MPAEPIQQSGRDGAAFAKRWLESTTWIELPFSAYRTAPVCTVHLLNGETKIMDLMGSFLTEPYDRIVYVEAKNYNSASNLQNYYREFLAHAYSATACALKRPGMPDPKFEFMFVTRHIFGPDNRWSKRLKLSELSKALEEYPEVLGDDAFDPDIGSLVMNRIWLLVYHQKQGELTLSQSEFHKVIATLKRKKEGLA